RDSVGQIAGGRAADSFEFKAARGGQGRCDNTILERKRREADGVVLDVKMFHSEFFRKMARGDERRAANGIGRAKIFGQRKKFRVAPHVEGATGKRLFARDLFQRIVVERDFERRETLFTK